MKCLMNGNNARTLAKAIQSLSKFGSNLFVEADDDGLLIRTINATQSAVGSFKFKRVFFERYLLDANVVNYCKITAKSCFNVFRNMKQVEHCEIQICVDELRFDIEIKCQHEQIKKVSISIIDEENVSAGVDNDDTQNTIVASYKIFNEMSSNFNAMEEEITLEALPDALIARNFIEGARVNDKFMRSQLKFSASELDVYDIKESTSITFCLKEFKAYLAFSEALNECVELKFSQPGGPLFLRIKKSDLLEGTLIMSTLSPENIEYFQNENDSVRMNTSTTRRSASNKRRMSNGNSNASNEPQTKRQNISHCTNLTDETVLFNFNSEATTNSNRNNENNEFPSDNTEHFHPNDVQIINNDDVHQFTDNNSISIEFCDTESQSENNRDEVIDQSPERVNKIRTIFSRCFQNTYYPEEPTATSEIFAPDSDNES